MNDLCPDCGQPAHDDDWSECIRALRGVLTAERKRREEAERERDEARAVLDGYDRAGRRWCQCGDNDVCMITRQRQEAEAALSAPPGADLVSVARACARVVEAAEETHAAEGCWEHGSDTGWCARCKDALAKEAELQAAFAALAALRAGKEPTDAR